MVVSQHARKRIKERAGKGISAERFVEKACERGLKHNELNGNLRKWVDGRVLYSTRPATPYIYDNLLLLFSGDGALITVLTVPANLQKAVSTLLKKKRDKAKEDS